MKSRWNPSLEDVQMFVLIAIIFGSFAWFSSGVVEYAQLNSNTQLAQVPAFPPGVPNDFGSGAMLLVGPSFESPDTNVVPWPFTGPSTYINFSESTPKPYVDFVDNRDYESLGVNFTASSQWGAYQLTPLTSVGGVYYITPVSTMGTGEVGVEINFIKPVLKAGLYIQNGIPFVSTSTKTAFQIRVIAYDESNTKIFEQEVSTCSNNATSCAPRLMGVYSPNKAIKKIQYARVGSSGLYSMDDLQFQTVASLHRLDSHLANSGQYIDFSQHGGYGQYGITLTSSSTIGFGWSQSNGFIGSLSGSVRLPGAPAGIYGKEIVFTNPVSRAGVFVQSGAPFDRENDRPAKQIKVIAYNTNNEKIFEWEQSTCPKGFTACKPEFIGVESPYVNIKKLQIIKLDSGSLSMDDLYFTPNTFPQAPPRIIGVSFPGQGNVLMANRIAPVNWYSSRIGSFSIGWSTGPGSYNTIASNIPTNAIGSTNTSGTYNWTVSAGNLSSGQTRSIQLVLTGYDPEGGTERGQSPFFTVVNAPTIVRLISPNGGDVISGSRVPVVYDKALATITPYPPVDIYLEEQKGAGDSVLLASNVPSNAKIDQQSHYVTIPSSYQNGGLYMIKVCETGTNYCDTSDSSFTITSSSTPPTPLVVTCTGKRTGTYQIEWTATVSGGRAPLNYWWFFPDDGKSAFSTSTTKIYTSFGVKNANLDIFSSDSPAQRASATCSQELKAPSK